MNNLVRVAAIGSFALLLGACHSLTQDPTTFGLERLKKEALNGTTFEQALAREYRDFAVNQAGEYDWQNSSYFASKGRSAASGATPLPENSDAWYIAAPFRPELRDARAKLIAALDGGARTRVPARAAKTQELYDCWVEEQEEGWQLTEINACKNGFYAELAGLTTVATATTSTTTTVAAPAPAPVALPPDVYLVFFAFDRSDISPVGSQVLDRVLNDFKTRNMQIILVNGHADRSGTDRYNQALSERRAAAVAKYLTARSIRADQIQTKAFGETQPRVPTADGVRNDENRRVEIFLRTR